MGGYGSGRRRMEVKGKTTDYLQLDVRAMNRQGALKPGRFFQWAWSRNGQVVASLPVLADHDRLVLERTGSSVAAFSEYSCALLWTYSGLGVKMLIRTRLASVLHISSIEDVVDGQP